MLHPFKELGTRIAAEWAKCDHRYDGFETIATSLLDESRLLHRVAPEEIMAWLMRSEKVPKQDAYEFGQPPVVVFESEKFFIQVLFWLDSSTSIHEHSFCGAFGVLAGSSVHSRYEFESDDPAPATLRLGRTRYLYSELLGQGDIRSIARGNEFAHALFHLEWPSVSVVVRTHKSDQQAPQYSYFKPYLAIDPFYAPALPAVQLRMLESLERIDRKLFWAHAQTLATACEPWTLFRIVCAAHGHRDDEEEWLSFLEQASARHLDMVEKMVRCSEEMQRETKLLSLRGKVLDPTHKFLLGLLLNVPDRTVLYHLIAQRFPYADPESLVLRWLSEIFDDKEKGIKLTAVSRLLLQLAMHHSSFEEAELILEKCFDGDAGKRQAMRKLWDKIRGIDIFAPLFTEGEKASRAMGEAA